MKFLWIIFLRVNLEKILRITSKVTEEIMKKILGIQNLAAGSCSKSVTFREVFENLWFKTQKIFSDVVQDLKWCCCGAIGLLRLKKKIFQDIYFWILGKKFFGLNPPFPLWKFLSWKCSSWKKIYIDLAIQNLLYSEFFPSGKHPGQSKRYLPRIFCLVNKSSFIVFHRIIYAAINKYRSSKFFSLEWGRKTWGRVNPLLFFFSAISNKRFKTYLLKTIILTKLNLINQ